MRKVERFTLSRRKVAWSAPYPGRANPGPFPSPPSLPCLLPSLLNLPTICLLSPSAAL